MSSKPGIIQLCSIDIGLDLINAARDECRGLDISTSTSYKAFLPGEKCTQIIESVKQQVCVYGWILLSTATAYAITDSTKSAST